MRKPFVAKGDKLRREKALVRAGYRCELGCRVFGKHNLQDHHLLPKSVYPQHRFKLINSAILCVTCHDTAENDPDRFEEKALQSPALRDRMLWALENTGVDKYPTEVDYEENVRLLKEAV